MYTIPYVTSSQHPNINDEAMEKINEEFKACLFFSLLLHILYQTAPYTSFHLICESKYQKPNINVIS